jgi:thiol-disulfide isomerase/thioredoxin
MSNSIACLLIVGIFTLGGCQDSTPTSSPSLKQPQQAEQPIVDPPPADDKVEIDVVSLEKLQALLTKADGKLVVCDYWSTSCQPCMKEFPHLVSLHKKHGSEVTCISASMEYDGLPSFPIDKCKAAALEFLTKQRATFKNVLLSDETLDVLDALEVPSLPIVEVYRNGKLLKRFVSTMDAEFSYEEQVIPFVEAQLAATKN